MQLPARPDAITTAATARTTTNASTTIANRFGRRALHLRGVKGHVPQPVERRIYVADRRLNDLARHTLEIVAVAQQHDPDALVGVGHGVVLVAEVVAGVEEGAAQLGVEAAPAQPPRKADVLVSVGVLPCAGTKHLLRRDGDLRPQHLVHRGLALAGRIQDRGQQAGVVLGRRDQGAGRIRLAAPRHGGAGSGRTRRGGEPHWLQMPSARR